MDESTRLHYLHAMGIDVWLPKISRETENLNLVAHNLQACQATLLLHTDEGELSDSADLQQNSTLRPNRIPDSWELVHAEVKACQACSLCQTRTQTVFGVGDHQADCLLIGLAPGPSEDEHGEPFVGKAGQLLNEMLLAVGMRREQVYMTNTLKCCPPNHRQQLTDEIKTCQDFLNRQITLIQPKIILAIGHEAAQSLLHQSVFPRQQYFLLGIPVFVIPHPEYLLSAPLEKAKAWEDLQYAWLNYQRLSTANTC